MSRKLIGVIALLAMGGALGGCATPSQMIADHKLAELCAKDGGVQVFQTVEIPVDEYDFSNKAPKGMSDAITACNGKYKPFSKKYALMCDDTIVSGSTKSIYINRSVYEVIDIESNVALGRYVHYSRFGGDFPLSTAEPVGRGCPTPAVGLTKAVFRVKGGAHD